MTIPETALLLVAAHALCDYPLQGDFLARAKNHRQPIDGVNSTLALLSHAAIHAGAVLLVTASLGCALVELVAHAVIDRAKCAGRISFATDQTMHLACKAAYVALLAIGDA